MDIFGLDIKEEITIKDEPLDTEEQCLSHDHDEEILEQEKKFDIFNKNLEIQTLQIIKQENEDIGFNKLEDDEEQLSFQEIQESKIPVCEERLNTPNEKKSGNFSKNLESPAIQIIKQEKEENYSVKDKDDEERLFFQEIQESKYPIILVEKLNTPNQKIHWKDCTKSSHGVKIENETLPSTSFNPQHFLSSGNTESKKLDSRTNIKEKKDDGNNDFLEAVPSTSSVDENVSRMNAKRRRMNPEASLQTDNVSGIKDNRSERVIKSNLRTQIKNSVSKLFNCSECGYETNIKHKWDRHLLFHKYSKSDQCKNCDFKTDTKSELSGHALCLAYVKKTLECSNCDYKTRDKSKFQKHLSRHAEIKLFQCPKCEYKSSKKENFKRHLKVHEDGKLFKCLECEYNTESKYFFSKHLLTHKNRLLHQCSLCEYKTKYLSRFKIHKLTHSTTRLYHCPVCHYETNYKSNVKRHNLKHTANKSLDVQSADTPGE